VDGGTVYFAPDPVAGKAYGCYRFEFEMASSKV